MPPTKKPSPPEHTNLSPDQMKKGIARLQRVVKEIEAFDPKSITKRWSVEQKAVEATIEGALSSVFGHNTVEYRRYQRAASLDHGSVSMGGRSWANARMGGGSYRGSPGLEEAIGYVTEGKAEAISLLNQAIRWLEDEMADSDVPSESVESGGRPEPAPLQRKVFIVHGHHGQAKEAVARFVEKLRFEAIILSEQANKGQTIIEKFEANSDVGFAIVLLTPDDVGGKLGDAQRPRARQNVLLELGYFIGRLGRGKVAALATSSDMELPTDIAGVVWEKFDDGGGWKAALARELEACGFDIDWNKVMKG